MSEECLICGSPLVYSERAVIMECSICHKEEESRTQCSQGHYVCNECHMAGLDEIMNVCLKSSSTNPFVILGEMMSLPFCHMHGPEHHIMTGAALLTAYKNAGGNIVLSDSLAEMMSRGKEVPGGSCGYWGACGAGISAGIFVSIITGGDPLSVEPFRLSHLMTAKALHDIGTIGGPRCCKRDSFLAVSAAVDFVRENFGVEMMKSDVSCKYSARNNQCIGTRCPFSKS